MPQTCLPWAGRGRSHRRAAEDTQRAKRKRCAGRNAVVAVITLPAATLISFMGMHRQGINANIMSLGGIAIAIGAMVDAAIVMIENAHKHLEGDAGKQTSLAHHRRCRSRGRTGAVLFIAGHHRFLMSIAVWVGIIALAGLDAETGVVMLLYLDHAHEDWKKRGLLRNRNDLADSVYDGAVRCVRPKIMTISVMIAGLLPILWSHGAGADVMKRIATPMVGGVVTSRIMELLIYPVVFYLWRSRGLAKGQ
ncbi:MAG: hypothetical protein FJW35_02380 [Acidobacteria bacterium]|nr:hypothetical protein [Acidobacteriota bacterium]